MIKICGCQFFGKIMWNLTLSFYGTLERHIRCLFYEDIINGYMNLNTGNNRLKILGKTCIVTT